MALIKCSECGKEVSTFAGTCPSCGYPMNQPMSQALVECSDCGVKIPTNAEFCPKCHVLQLRRQTTTSSVTVLKLNKSKGTATALAIFLGGIGIHKFYLEQPGKGILYALFCWTFIPAILGLLEGISMASMSNEKFAKHYNLK